MAAGTIEILDMEGNHLYDVLQRKSLKVETELKPYDRTLSFSYPDSLYSIACEYFAVFDDEQYVIKEVSALKDGWRDVVAVLDLTALQNNVFASYSKTQTAGAFLADATADTGWAYSLTISDSTAVRSIDETCVNGYEIIEKAREVFGLDVQYDTGSMTVIAAETIGSDRGTAFLNGVNLKKCQVERESHDYCTRLIPLGADGIDITSVNGGVNYIDASGAKKMVALIWQDTAYTTPADLLAAAKYKLGELSKVSATVSVSITDLAAMMPDSYGDVLPIAIGDTVRVVDDREGISDSYRVTRLTEYPDNPGSNGVELGNRAMSFEDYAKTLKDTAAAVNKIVISMGEVQSTLTSITG